MNKLFCRIAQFAPSPLIPVNLRALKAGYLFKKITSDFASHSFRAGIGMRSPQPYLTVASILSGFGISVFMFRIQRELGVRDRHPDWPNWLAWADYLVLAAIVSSLSLVVLPLIAYPEPSELVFSVAAGTCAATSLLLLAYPFAILDHYRIEIGVNRSESIEVRHKGQPIEKIIVIVTCGVALLVFLSVIVLWKT